MGDEMTWHDLGLRGDVARAAENMGLEKPTEVQAKGAKEVLSGKDALLASHTGSGKTLGYLLPMVSKLKDQEESLGVKGSQPRRPRALVLAPTRELSEQVLTVAKSLSHRAKVATAGASGGTKLKPQRDRLAHSVDILVGTPGRVLFHCERKDLNLSAVDIVVLDEADTLVTGGFQECQEVVRRVREGERRKPAQVVMAAATVSKAVERELERACSDSDFQRVTTSSLHRSPQWCHHRFLEVPGSIDKLEFLTREASNGKLGRSVVFCNTVRSCRAAEHALREAGVETVHCHGEMPSRRRTGALQRFSAGEGDALVCTDIASRGIDFRVSSVVNFDFPRSTQEYIHRAGRAGRSVEGGGIVTSLVRPKEAALAREIDFCVARGEPMNGRGSSSAGGRASGGGNKAKGKSAKERAKERRRSPQKRSKLVQTGSRRASTSRLSQANSRR